MAKVIPRPGLSEIGYYMVGISKLTGFKTVAKLSSNESPLGLSVMAKRAARLAINDAHRYPEVDGARLRDALSDHFALEASRVTFGPGSDELLTRLVATFAGPGDEVVFSKNAYMQFPIYALRAGATPVAAPDQDFRHSVDSLLACVTEKTRIVILANPDNPSGTYLSGSEVRRLHAGLPDHVLTIVDSAYEEYAAAPDYESATHLVHSFDNVVVTRTFSKVFGMAGLRLGWCYASKEVIDLLERIGPSFPANVAANAAALAAIQDPDHTARVLSHNATWLDWFSAKLSALGLYVYPSQTNFVLVRFPDHESRSAAAANAFLLSRGVIPRRFAVEGFENKLRFTIGRSNEMKKAARVLTEFMGS